MKRVRRVKITVREKETTIVRQGTGHSDSPENTQLTVCPFCKSSLHLLKTNSQHQIQEKNISLLLKKGLERDLEGEGK